MQPSLDAFIIGLKSEVALRQQKYEDTTLPSRSMLIVFIKHFLKSLGKNKPEM